MPSDERAEVSVHHGRVIVGTLVVAECPWYGATYGLMVSVRERTPREWWRRAAEIIEAEALSTEGPLGAGVDFFVDEMHTAVPEDVREALQHEAYEAARDEITEGLIRHQQRMARTVVAL